MSFENLFRTMINEGASDLFIKTGSRPAMRVDGKIVFLSESPTTPEFAQELYETVTRSDLQRRRFEQEHEIDVGLKVEDAGRFRLNLYRQQGELAFVFRHVRDDIPTFSELGLPIDAAKKVSSLPRGLVLATGVTGSGKSTTLASMLEFINERYYKHIITIEDPIEYVVREVKCVISQREIGFDSVSFANALKHCVRQSPDVIMIGEMRDRETMDAAINAAETGHLVFSTLHTVNAIQTVERIISYYPPHQHNLIRLQMSLVLEGVFSQRLLPRADGKGRVPAVEVMLGTPSIKEILEEGRTKEIHKALYEGSQYFKTQTFHQSIRDLYRADLITLETALEAADNPEELKLELRGITKGTRADLDFNF
jgi:twitching motility protein PilT